MYVVTVSFEINRDQGARFLARMRRQATDSLAKEPGCHRFDVCINPETAERVFLYELYEDRAAFDLHLASEHFRAFDAEVAEMVHTKTVQTWALA